MTKPNQIDPKSPLLKAFQNLGALGDEFGLYKIKPFRDWNGNKYWQHKIFTFRLCNSGEVLDVLQSVQNLNEDASAYYKKFELLSRAIWSIDDQALCSQEEVTEYNQQNHVELTVHEFLVNYMHNLEDLVLSRLDAVYAALQVKQVRMLQGVLLCDSCGQVFKELPESGKRLVYSLSEIICDKCIGSIDSSLYDFQDKPEKNVATETINNFPVGPVTTAYPCICGMEFDDYEAYRIHITQCEKYADSAAIHT
jgi:hypothetical protein